MADGVGVRTFIYSDALPFMNETLLANGVTNVIARSYDSKGRSTGYALRPGGTTSVSSASYAYADNGRFSTISATIGSKSNFWTYSYLANGRKSVPRGFCLIQHLLDSSAKR